MKKIVVFSGAGISAESGLSTFRDQGGLWDKYPIEEVATVDAWNANPEKVTDFYNLRRENCKDVKPNDAHRLIADLEKKYLVNIVTQNIDDLHERSGSTNVLHLHGQIMLARSWGTKKTYPIKNNDSIIYGDKCPDGFLLRPDVVWFGEAVPNMNKAAEIVSQADFFIIIGTSLQVYPAAGLVNLTSEKCEKFIIDPNEMINVNGISHIKLPATKGMKKVYKQLINAV